MILPARLKPHLDETYYLLLPQDFRVDFSAPPWGKRTGCGATRSIRRKPMRRKYCESRYGIVAGRRVRSAREQRASAAGGCGSHGSKEPQLVSKYLTNNSCCALILFPCRNSSRPSCPLETAARVAAQSGFLRLTIHRKIIGSRRICEQQDSAVPRLRLARLHRSRNFVAINVRLNAHAIRLGRIHGLQGNV